MNWSALEVAEVPSGVVTVTSTVPVPAGAVAVIEVSEFTVKLVAGVAPKSTAAVPVKPVPLTETMVPPEAGPEVGLMLVIALLAATPILVQMARLVDRTGDLLARRFGGIVTAGHGLVTSAGYLAVLLLCLSFVAQKSYSPFIYFRF